MGAGGVEALREAVRILPEDADAKLRARVLEMLARRTMLSGDPQQGIEFSQQAVDAAARADSDSVTANAWITLGTSLAAAGQEDEGLAAFERVSHLARSSPRTLLRFYINYSDALNHVGRYEDAASQAMSGVEWPVSLVCNAPSAPCSRGMPPSRCSRSGSGHGHRP